MSTDQTQTPRTDAAQFHRDSGAHDLVEMVVTLDFARQLERELADVKASHDHVCRELAACEEARDANAELCNEATAQRDRLAEELRALLANYKQNGGKGLGLGPVMRAKNALAGLEKETP